MLRYTNVYNYSDVELTLINYFRVSRMLQGTSHIIICMMCCYIYCSCFSALSMNNHFLPLYTGPKVEEVGIFWQMVMEHKPTVVVMLTKVEENGKVWMVFESLQFLHMPQSWLYIHPHISSLMCACRCM